jgi:hypothetical protein
MKTLTNRLLEGIRPRPQGGYEFDYEFDDPNTDVIFLDSIETNAPREDAEIKKYSPYRFRGNYEDLRNILKDFDVKTLLGPTPWKADRSDVWEFFDMGAKRFIGKVGEKNFDVAITPHAPPSKGGKSQLCNIMLSSIELYGNVGMSVRGGVAKSSLENIDIDETSLLNDLGRIYDEEKAFEYFDDVKKMVANAQRDGTFKMKNVLPQWRKYVRGFLEVKDEVSKAIINARTILFVDDYHTSNSTVREVARLIKEVNPEARLYAYTLAKSYT